MYPDRLLNNHWPTKKPKLERRQTVAFVKFGKQHGSPRHLSFPVSEFHTKSWRSILHGVYNESRPYTFYFAPVWMRSIAMSVCVCLSARLSQTRRPTSADRIARRQFQAAGQPVSRTQASDAMTSRLPRYEAKCVQ